MARFLTDEEQAQHERLNGRFGDARAQLWARVYAHELAAVRAVFHASPPADWREHPLRIDVMHVVQRNMDAASQHARDLAARAVRDFDEHYLGGKR
jgi:hypothetical protein